MTTFILCTSAERDHIVAGTGHLFPIPLANGTEWVLPLACLADLEQAEWHDYLAALPQREVGDNEFVPPPTDDTL